MTTLTAMPKYEAYKDSGVEWLGDIPEHWGIVRLKSLSPVKRGASPRPIDSPKYFSDNGEFSWVRIADVTASNHFLYETSEKLSKLGASCSVKLQPGSLFLSIAGSVGKPIITKIKCCIHDGFVYFPTLKINIEFVFRLFESGQPFNGLGKHGTQLNLNTDTVGNIYIGLPSLKEQTAIANFLDEKTTKIDEAIAIKEKQIELLKERKQIIIQQAVTQGLDPTVPMKDSGVEWIGQIPEHWDEVKLKYAVEFIQTGPFGTELHASDYIKSGIPLINPKHLVNGLIVPEDDCTIDAKTTDRLKKYQLRQGDLILARRGELGRCAIVSENENRWICGTGSLMLRPKTEFYDIKYLCLLISDTRIKRTLSLSSVGSTMDNLNTTILGSITLTLPSIAEQKEIVDYVDKKFNETDFLIKNELEQIENLKEYKTTLINSAVTGKIKVV